MSEEKKKDALADALNALAAGDHVEDPPQSGSGVAGHAHDDHVPLTPAPAPAAPLPPQATPRSPTRPAPPQARPAAGGASPASSAASGAPPASSKAGAARPANAVPLKPTSRTANPAPTARPPAAPPSRLSAPRPATPAAGGTRPGTPASPRPAGATPPQPVARTTPPPARPGNPPPSGGASPRPTTPGIPVRPVSAARPAPVPPPARVAPPSQPPAPPAASQPPGDAFVVHDDTGVPSDHPLSDREAMVAAEADAIAHVVEDDDTLNLPAPGPEAFAPRRPPARPKRTPVSRTVEFKQTLIPILLTQGVLLPGIAAYLLLLGEESPLTGHAWIPLTLLGIGVALLLFAALTMLQVRHQLAQRAAASAAA